MEWIVRIAAISFQARSILRARSTAVRGGGPVAAAEIAEYLRSCPLTICASARSALERISLRAVLRNRIERKLPGGRWLSRLF
jgi:hypothetical protein